MKTICADARDFLDNLTGKMPAVFTSLPDADETGHTLQQWEGWFRTTVTDILESVDDKGYAVFYQTDRKATGQVLSKAGLILAIAHENGYRVMWHKIVLTGAVGAVNLFRPGYTHLICLSRHGAPGKATEDVIEAGRKVYPNATGLNACKLVFEFFERKGIKTVYDLFCGRGSIGFIGLKYFSVEVVSVDIDPEQCAKADELIATAAGGLFN